jgi:hypothetical protein
MTSYGCAHPRKVTGTLQFDFARPTAPNGPRYSAPLSVSVCEDCGRMEFHDNSQTQLCAWLKGAAEQTA